MLGIMTTGANAVSTAAHQPLFRGGKVVVADRASGTISVISTRTDQLIDTIELPAGENPPEPMYVYYTIIGHRVWVGDRANDRVVAFDARTFEVDSIVPAGEGVFHMWGNPFTRQLWVNNDLDNTTTVIDMHTMDVLETVPTPADLVAMGGKPHDVIVAPGGLFAYVTVIGVEGENDYVVQYSAITFDEIGRAAVGGDPHVSLTWRTPFLYVPSQDGNAVHVLNRFTMHEVDAIDIPGAHGAGMTLSGRYVYTTNLPGEGEDALWVIDTWTLEIVAEPVDSPYTVPHNIVLTPNGRKLYLTHSGPNDKVTIYETSRWDPQPELIGEVTVGMNPFGLDYVP
jgi:DNA-binding beta-propeller fold protein YncE